MKKISMLLVLLLAALSSLSVMAQERVVIFLQSDADRTLEGYFILTGESLVGIQLIGGFNGEHRIYSRECFVWAVGEEGDLDESTDPNDLFVNRQWTVGNYENGFYNAGGRDGQIMLITTCESSDDDESQEEAQGQGNFDMGDNGELIVVPVQDENTEWAYSSGYDAAAENCTEGDPVSCRSFSILHPLGMTRAELRTHLQNVGVVRAVFGQKNIPIPNLDYEDALTALADSMPEGNMLVVVGG